MNKNALEERIGKRLKVRGTLTLETPMIIGGGQDDLIDISVIKDNEGYPYIPGTSFAGLMRHHFNKYAKIDESKKDYVEYFWGTYGRKDTNEITYQSALIVDDLELKNKDLSSLSIRDGVKIDANYGVAVDNFKFNYEVVNPGASFDLNFEVIIREKFLEEGYYFNEIVLFLLQALSNKKIAIGSMTTKGFGRVNFENFTFYSFDFSNAEHIKGWLLNDLSKASKIDFKDSIIEVKKENSMKVHATFAIKTSLLIKSHPVLSHEPDAVHISSGGNSFIPGTSLKGVIRNRANRILNTLQNKSGENPILNKLFGAMDECKKEKYRSRFIIEETIINDETTMKRLHHRVRIDRFTGGVMNSGLFDSEPIWPKYEKRNEEMVEVIFELKEFKDWEVGLLLQVLKDLWVGDLTVGGEKSVGRGALKGLLAEVQINDDVFKISEKDRQLVVEGDKEKLEKYATKLVIFSEKEVS